MDNFLAIETDEIKLIDTGICTLCGSSSVFRCGRCGDFYCSNICQRKDWHNHRYICFPMPELIKVDSWSKTAVQCNIPALQDLTTEVLEKENDKKDLRKSCFTKNTAMQKNKEVLEGKITKVHEEGKTEEGARKAYSSKNSEEVLEEERSEKNIRKSYIAQSIAKPPNGSCVTLTGFKTFNRCYIRSTNPTIVAENNKVLNEIDEYGKISSAFSDKPKTNSFALVLRGNKWRRAKILQNQTSKQVRVFFVDYGIISVRDVNDLRKIPPRIASLPCFVHMVQLKGVKKCFADLNFMNSNYVNKSYRLEFVEPDELGGDVELYHWKSNNLLNSEIVNIRGMDINNKDTDDTNISLSISNFNDSTKKKAGSIEEGTKSYLQAKPAITETVKQQTAEDVKKSYITRITSMPPDGSCVTITAFRSYKYCYICSINPTIVAENRKVLNEINEYGKSSTALSGKPHTNSFALAMRENKWCRVKILEIIADDCFEVLFVDFGSISKIFINDLRKISSHIASLPCFVHMVKLDAVINCVDEQLTNFLTKYINKKYILDLSGTVGDTVNLYTIEDGKLLNTILMDLYRNIISNKLKEHPAEDEDTLSTIDTKVIPCMVPPFTFIPIDELCANSRFVVVATNLISTGFIACVLHKNFKHFLNIIAFLKQYDVGNQPYKPIVNEYCIGYYGNRWHRIRVKEVLAKDKFSVVCIDFIYELELTSESIRPYPESLTLPCCTTKCGIYGMPEDISEKLNDFLQSNFTPFEILTIKDVHMKSGIPFLTILGKETLHETIKKNISNGFSL